jgi:alkylhydroperoxidase family enzyme
VTAVCDDLGEEGVAPMRTNPSDVVGPLAPEVAATAAASVGMSDGASTINLFRVLLHSPPAAAMINGLKDTALRRFALDARLRELAIMRTAWLMGAEYVWNHHTRPYVEHDLELNPGDVLEVRDWASSTAFGPTERAVLQLTDEMVLGRHGEVSRDALSNVLGLLPPAQTVELVVTVAVYRGISSVARSLDVPMEDSYGRWEPDGRAPTE